MIAVILGKCGCKNREIQENMEDITIVYKLAKDYDLSNNISLIFNEFKEVTKKSHVSIKCNYK